MSPPAAPAPLPRERMASPADAVLASLGSTAGRSNSLLSRVTLNKRHVNAGELLVREGEEATSIHVLDDGWGCRFTSTRDGKRQVPAILLPGDVCNLEVLAFDRPGYGVRMLTSGAVLTMPLHEARALCAANPDIAWTFFWLGFIEHSILTQWALWLARLSARDRLVHLLCELGVRLGRGTGAGEASFELPMTQEWLADLLGLTAVHVNRTLQQLRREGLLASGMHRIIVSDMAALRRSVSFDPAYLHRDGPPERRFDGPVARET
jgi:CRP-like cAMP-binding protein